MITSIQAAKMILDHGGEPAIEALCRGGIEALIAYATGLLTPALEGYQGPLHQALCVLREEDDFV